MPFSLPHSDSGSAFSAPSANSALKSSPAVSFLALDCKLLTLNRFPPTPIIPTLAHPHANPCHSYYIQPTQGGTPYLVGPHCSSRREKRKSAGLKDQRYMQECREVIQTKNSCGTRCEIAPRPAAWGGRVSGHARRNGEGAHPDAYSGDDVQRKPNETVGL